MPVAGDVDPPAFGPVVEIGRDLCVASLLPNGTDGGGSADPRQSRSSATQASSSAQRSVVT
jgi:hypothetical protein